MALRYALFKNRNPIMKQLIFIALFCALCVTKIWAGHQIIPLEQCKNWKQFSQLDSVVVYFQAENKHLSFTQVFSELKKVHGSSQITLRQTELDRSHFKRALAIVNLAIDFFLSNSNSQGGTISQNTNGLSSVIYLDQHVASRELWRNMYKTFGLVKKTGLAENIQVHAYTH